MKMPREETVTLTAQQFRDLIENLDRLARRVGLLETQERSTNSLTLKDGVTAPSAVSGLAILFVDTSDGDLKVTFGDGTTKTIVADT